MLLPWFCGFRETPVTATRLLARHSEAASLIVDMTPPSCRLQTHRRVDSRALAFGIQAARCAGATVEANGPLQQVESPWLRATWLTHAGRRPEGGGGMERLTAQDLSMVWPDDVGWPQDIGALAILDGTGLFDPQGRFRIEAMRAAIQARLHLVPRFRQLLLLPPRGLGWPLWVDAPSFEVSDHVRAVQLPAPGDEVQLLLTAERLRRRPARPVAAAVGDVVSHRAAGG